MFRIVIVSAALLLALGACKTIPVAGECPEVAELRCLTEKVCTLDLERDCIECMCGEPGGPNAPGWSQQPFDDANRLPDPMQD